MKMSCNVGVTDKIVRVVIGIIGLWLASAYSPLWLLLSLAMFLTAGVSWCPVNKMMGVNTCHVKTEHTKDEHKKEGGMAKPMKEQTPKEESMMPEDHKDDTGSGESKLEM
ncbi:MAG: hypothetical protein COT39_04135 [Parcubacteria group bacterium CG08_land_8_20_14_0_20_48_21]|nr:MAG: hypothetical protein AUK21_00760 [Parcubacteria group bacterium CG2_30_48_51]PIS32504.1 MAG: hypothetical protein COT39_04135 [Parcubacteria group bacterium CG08_land_8_20_14_0_20_48_21]PIW79537.1 MAG: hypothetical protein COZ99_00605 [Parcubacteria group bacterium CG_4_8_14_3_um_filter_48_16]PIY78089.1 MAG: hypothetical protein COY83_01655 [Parcubacteria group bacterium CG_4_10_14_0_8_um_filter_48_154]PIZ77655.1 MAG: hypothetical protein COY03_02035 [bacterium CG_4_10_14_0_2_um_filter_